MIYQHQIQMLLPSWNSWSVWFVVLLLLLQHWSNQYMYAVLGPYSSISENKQFITLIKTDGVLVNLKGTNLYSNRLNLV